MALHRNDQLYEWLERDSIVEDCEFRYRDDPAFEIEVATSEASVRVRRHGETAPVRIVGTTEVDPAQLVAFDRDAHRQNFLGQLTAVVTSTDGRFAFRDEDGERCDMRDVRRVEFETRIYPGRVTRHELLRSVQEISNATGYLEVILENYQQFSPPAR